MYETTFILEGLAASQTAAVAYIDPATTSYIIQIIVGAVVAVGTFFGIYRAKIKRLFQKKKEEEAAPVEQSSDVQSKELITAEDLLDD